MSCQRAMIGMGSNLGDRKALLDFAANALATAEGVSLRAVSPYHETAPVGGPADQGPFLNAAAVVDTTLAPDALLRLLHSIEQEAGRVRVIRWGERTLDLDLLLHGDAIIETPELTVPHPRMSLRRFVLAPLSEIAPDALDPRTGRTIASLLANLDRRPAYLALAGPFQPTAQPLSTGPRTIDGRPLLKALRTTLPDLHPLGFEPAKTWDDLARWLAPEHVREVTGGRGWVITPFWLDAYLLSQLTPRRERDRAPDRIQRLREIRDRAYPPTFVVIPETAYGYLRSLDNQRRQLVPIGFDTPLLRVSSFDASEAIAEIIATCQGLATPP